MSGLIVVLILDLNLKGAPTLSLWPRPLVEARTIEGDVFDRIADYRRFVEEWIGLSQRATPEAHRAAGALRRPLLARQGRRGDVWSRRRRASCRGVAPHRPSAARLHPRQPAQGLPRRTRLIMLPRGRGYGDSRRTDVVDCGRTSTRSGPSPWRCPASSTATSSSRDAYRRLYHAAIAALPSAPADGWPLRRSRSSAAPTSGTATVSAETSAPISPASPRPRPASDTLMPVKQLLKAHEPDLLHSRCPTQPLAPDSPGREPSRSPHGRPKPDRSQETYTRRENGLTT